jgi:hypothetical protein
MGAGASVTTLTAEEVDTRALLELFAGWSFLASGLVAWARRPENRVGVFMTAIGLI